MHHIPEPHNVNASHSLQELISGWINRVYSWRTYCCPYIYTRNIGFDHNAPECVQAFCHGSRSVSHGTLELGQLLTQGLSVTPRGTQEVHAASRAIAQFHL